METEMAIENNSSEAYAYATGPKFTFFSNSEWLKLFVGNPAKLHGAWNEALGLTA
jgi:YHS domain-containing protein